MMFRYLAPAAALLGLAAAQVTSDCNPLNETDCDPNPAFGTDWTWNFNTTPPSALWDTHVGKIDFDEDKGAIFAIEKQGDSPTIRSNFYFFWGRTEIILKAAHGTGIVSSMMWLSDDLDEVDWELLGFNSSVATTNYYGKGREDFTQGGVHDVKGGILDDYHNYTTTWTKEKLEWWIDGDLVRTLLPEDANKTDNYPQTPMRMSLGIWAAGDPDMPKGTQDWAGGETKYDEEGPFYMYVKKVQVTDYSSGKEYVYGDQSGDYKSIEIVKGNSTAYDELHNPKQPKKTTQEKWDEIPTGAKTAIYAGGAGAAAVFAAGMGYFIWRQRQLGANESRLAEEKAATERRTLMGMDDSAAAGTEYSSGYNRV